MRVSELQTTNEGRTISYRSYTVFRSLILLGIFILAVSNQLIWRSLVDESLEKILLPASIALSALIVVGIIYFSIYFFWLGRPVAVRVSEEGLIIDNVLHAWNMLRAVEYKWKVVRYDLFLYFDRYRVQITPKDARTSKEACRAFMTALVEEQRFERYDGRIINRKKPFSSRSTRT